MFKSGAGMALHMRHVRGEFIRGPYSSSGLEGRRASLARVRERSPSHQSKGQRITLTCQRPECQATFDVVPSQATRRKYCSKSCSGKSHPPREITLNQRRAISKAQKERFAQNPESNPFYGRTPTNYQGWGHGGFCEELGLSVRSTWEREYLLGLQRAGVPFAYEPQRFSLGDGLGTYMPDIQLSPTVFVEITGWDKPEKIRKRHLFVEKYEVTLHVVNKRPTPETIQALVDFAQEVIKSDDCPTA